MLVLSRTEMEAITIGSLVTVRVVAIRGGRVRLGIEAPTAVAVHREEVAQRIQKEGPKNGHANVCPCCGK